LALGWSQINTKNNNAFTFFYVCFENFRPALFRTSHKFCFYCGRKFTTEGNSLLPVRRWYFLSISAKGNNQRKSVVTREPSGSYGGNINACPLSVFVMKKWFTTVIMILGTVVHNIDNKIVITACYWLDPHPSHYSIGSN
jgi:hypothetical protein